MQDQEEAACTVHIVCLCVRDCSHRLLCIPGDEGELGLRVPVGGLGLGVPLGGLGLGVPVGGL